MKYLIIAMAISMLSLNIQAQTCCSSGVPIASNIGFQSQGKNVLQVSLGLESNRLSTLYNESKVLEGNNRLRITNTALLRLAYNLHERLILETLLPYVSQLRKITQNNQDVNFDGGHGIGDLTILGQLVLAENRFSMFSIGGGVKLPTGATDLTNSIGLLLVNDLQLGTGAVDFLARISAVRNLTLRPSVSFFLNATSIFRGSNDDYLGNQSYKFGSEIQANLGYSDQVFFMKTLVYPSMSVRFRSAMRDQINQNELENTGGTWIFGRIGMGIDLFQGHRLSLAFEHPLYSKVVGTQLSPTYIFNFSYYKAIDFTRSDF